MTSPTVLEDDNATLKQLHESLQELCDWNATETGETGAKAMGRMVGNGRSLDKASSCGNLMKFMEYVAERLIWF